MTMNNELLERYNNLINVITDGLSRGELAEENRKLKAKIGELADLVKDQEDRILELEAILYQNGIPFSKED